MPAAPSAAPTPCSRAAALVLLTLSCAVPAAAAGTGDLSGQTLRITMIHEPGFVDMLGPDGFVKPTAEWGGFLVDLLARIASEAGFTYTLHSPSGSNLEGGLCAPTNLTGPARQAFYATQYNCGQRDTEIGNSDVYWGMYYITSGRIKRGTLFTTPYLSDKGLSMLTSAKAEAGWTDEIYKLFKPFTGGMWALSVATVCFFTLVLWVLEDHTAEPNRPSTRANFYSETKEGDDEGRQMQGGEGRGYLTADTARNSGVNKLYYSFLTLTAHGSPVALSNLALVYSVVFSFFALIWVAAYTANLASILQTLQLEAPFTTLPEFLAAQKSGEAGMACAKAGTACVQA
jgi:hypothetical protein